MKSNKQYSTPPNESLFKAVGTESQPDKDFLDNLETLSTQVFSDADASDATSQGFESLWRHIMKNRLFKLSTAAVILIAVFAGLTLVPNQTAYAQAVQGLRKAQTLTYTLIRQTNLEPGQTVSIQVAHKAPCHIRTTTVDGYISILDDSQGKMITLVPHNQMYITADYKNLSESKDMIDDDPFAIIEKMRNLPAKADQVLDVKMIDNVTARGYRVFENDTVITVWIDEGTYELVQLEQDYPSSPGMNYIMRDIQLDMDLDDSLFSLTPPAGYNEGLKLTADAAQITEDDFIKFFETWINLTVDKTFPPTFWSPEFGKIVIEMGKQGKFAREWTPEDAQIIYQGNMFLAQVPQDDWRYVGPNVPYGDPETPVFWYRPIGSENYRVIYADLSVKEVPADQFLD